MRKHTPEQAAAALERKRQRAREHQRLKRLHDPEGMRERNRRWFRENPDRVRALKARPITRWRTFEKHLRDRYGIGIEDYARLELSQNRCCAGCGDPLATSSGKKVHLDHDHITGAIRGLLCNTCNFALGMIGDCPNTLRRLAAYIDQHAQPVAKAS